MIGSVVIIIDRTSRRSFQAQEHRSRNIQAASMFLEKSHKTEQVEEPLLNFMKRFVYQ